MDKLLKITLDIEPTTTTFQSNAKIVKRGSFYSFMMPKKSKGYQWKEKLHQLLLPYVLEDKIDCACSLHIIHLFSYPKSWSKKDKIGLKPKTTRPDCDNLNKITQDVFAELFLEDDARIADLGITKGYAEIPKLIFILKKIDIYLFLENEI